MLSRPLGIYWAGWETTTVRLQRSGWDLAVEHDFHRDGYTLLLRHEAMRMHAYTDQIVLDRALHDPYYSTNMPVFTVRHVACSLQSVRTSLDLSAFHQIDAEPQIADFTIQRVEDLNIFALARNKAEEVLVNKADMTVIEHLEAIKRLQEPKQRELRQQMLREERAPIRQTPRLQLVAQLVHLEEAA